MKCQEVKSSSREIESKRTNELAMMRKEIQDITKSIMKLAKKRQELSSKIANYKAAKHLSVQNSEVENNLRNLVSEYARKIGLEEAFSQRILDLLLDFSKKAQREQIFRQRITQFLEEEKISSIFIVGSGRMGSWFTKYFRALGMDVSLFDVNRNLARKRAKELDCKYTKNIRESLSSDLILLAVPINETLRELESLDKLLANTESRCRAIIEISSIKGSIPGQQKNSPVPMISIHPLFGSSASNFDANTIVVINYKARGNFGYDLISKLFPQFNVVQLDSESHDEQMATLLSLPHALALAFRDVAVKKISDLKVSTPSYSAMNEFTSKVLSENPDVYFEIQAMNKFTPKVLEQLNTSLRELSGYIKDGKREEFRKVFLANVEN